MSVERAVQELCGVRGKEEPSGAGIGEPVKGRSHESQVVGIRDERSR